MLNNNEGLKVGKFNNDQGGFSTVEAVLILVIVGLVSFTGWYVWHTGKKTAKSTDTTSHSKQDSMSDGTKKPAAAVKYLSIPEEGIKFQLSPEIQDAYYFKSQQGYIYLSTRTLDKTQGAEGCSAKDNDGLGGGLMALIVGKVGQPNDSPSGALWTQEELDNSGLTKVGETYYGFQHGNGPCYDVNNANAAHLADTTIQAFVKQESTITKL